MRYCDHLIDLSPAWKSSAIQGKTSLTVKLDNLGWPVKGGGVQPEQSQDQQL
jgi:hypothetical protein